MTIRNLRHRIVKKIAHLLAVGTFFCGTFLCGSMAQAQISHFVGDASFDDNPVPAAANYAYWIGPPDTLWESDGNWWYNSSYDLGRRPDCIDACRPIPRTGNQALHGIAAYNWQGLSDTFVAGNTYTLSLYAAGDSDAGITNSDRIWMYMYDADNLPAVFDSGALAAWAYDFDGATALASGASGAGIATNTGWPRDAGPDWGLASLSYTATAADHGKRIGIAFYGQRDVAIDDISLVSVPEPTSVYLCGLGILGIAALRRRRL